MPRVLGVDLPNDKRIDIALTYLYGIGDYRAAMICREIGLAPETRARDLKDDDVARIAAFIDQNFNDEQQKDSRSGPVEGALRRKLMMDIGRLKKIQCYRGIRHIRGLPCRGQRTRTNARTRKGRRKTVANKAAVGK